MFRALGIVIFCLLTACKQEIKVNAPAIYYWKTVFKINDGDLKIWKDAGIQKIGLRFFDVEWSEGNPVPVGELKLESTIPANFEVEPVVFIKEEVIRKLDSSQARALGVKISNRVMGMAHAWGIQMHALQLDCDWTFSSKSVWFSLLQGAQSHLKGKEVYATLRLHQLVYSTRMGIPPVKKAILMMYNIGSPGKFEGRNSIFEAKEIKKYLSKASVSYPLALDVAIPIFSWGVLHRNGKRIRLLNGMKKEDIDIYINKVSNIKSIVKTPFRWQGFEIIQGDQIIIESAGFHEAQKAMELFYAFRGTKIHSLFIFDHQNLSLYDPKQIKSVFQMDPSDYH